MCVHVYVCHLLQPGGLLWGVETDRERVVVESIREGCMDLTGSQHAERTILSVFDSMVDDYEE